MRKKRNRALTSLAFSADGLKMFCRYTPVVLYRSDADSAEM